MPTATLNHDAELPVTEQDCLDYLGDSGRFFFNNNHHLRIGQRWMNALEMDDYRKLTGTLYDPFHRDDWLSVRQALMFLLEH